MKCVARFARVMLVHGCERLLTGAASEQLLANPRHRAERLAAGLEGQRDGDIGPAADGDGPERVELERGEVVESVDEQRRAAPGLGLSRVRRGRARRTARIGEPRRIEAGAIAAVDRGHLLGIGATKPEPLQSRKARAKRAGSTIERSSSATKRAAARAKPGCPADSASTVSPVRRTASSTISSRWRSDATGAAYPVRSATSWNSQRKRSTSSAEDRAALGDSRRACSTSPKAGTTRIGSSSRRP